MSLPKQGYGYGFGNPRTQLLHDGFGARANPVYMGHNTIVHGSTKRSAQKERPFRQEYHRANVDQWTTIVEHTSN